MNWIDMKLVTRTKKWDGMHFSVRVFYSRFSSELLVSTIRVLVTFSRIENSDRFLASCTQGLRIQYSRRHYSCDTFFSMHFWTRNYNKSWQRDWFLLVDPTNHVCRSMSKATFQKPSKKKCRNYNDGDCTPNVFDSVRREIFQIEKWPPFLILTVHD